MKYWLGWPSAGAGHLGGQPMSIHFRRSVRLFPGVRLNFSRSGISTTVGVRGASMTVGPGGTYLNAGIPGSGLSYRTRLQSTADAPKPSSGAEVPPYTPPEQASSASAVEIRSGEMATLTSPGLGELKRLINKASVKRHELAAQVETEKEQFARSAGRLRFAQTFIVRIFTRKSVPRLVASVEKAREQLDSTSAALEECFIEVDFGFDENTLNSYAALIRSFETVTACQRIWDITSIIETNRVAERTVATRSFSRTPVLFDFVTPEIVKSQHQPMRLSNASKRDIHLYPGFLMMRDTDGDFALIEYREITLSFSQSRFIEEETSPTDSEVVGQTWKKANKDGSPDRRFNNNYAIPILSYGQLMLSSPTGLLEGYMFSNHDAASTFAAALESHQRSLSALETKGGVASTEVADDDEPEAAPAPSNNPVAQVESQAFMLDWAALLLGLFLMGSGVNFGIRHGGEVGQKISAMFQPPAAVAAPSPADTPALQSTKQVHKHHKKRHRHAHALAGGPSREPSSTADATG